MELGKYTMEGQFTEWFRTLGIPTVGIPMGPAAPSDWASTKNAAKQLNWLPMAAEVRYGEESHKEETNIRDRRHKLGKKYYPLADEMLKRILASLGQQTDYTFQLFIPKKSNNEGGGNAVARPGGFLYIEEGLIKDPKWHPKAYFALAHEVAHVLQRHETQALQSMVVDSVSGVDDFLSIATRIKGDPKVILNHVKTGKNVFIRYHIDQELQADSCAARMLNVVFPDQKDFVQSINAFVRSLPRPESDRPKGTNEPLDDMVDIVDTPIKQHPNDQERRDNLQKICAEVAKDTGTNCVSMRPIGSS